MSGKELFEAMSNINERFVEEAERETIPGHTPSLWRKMVPMAACLCLIAGLYLLNPHWLSGLTEGIPSEPQTENVEDINWPGQEIDSEMQQESQESILPAEGSLSPETASVVLRVEEMTEEGFIGTVAALMDTDLFEIGRSLNVVFADDARIEITGSAAEYKNQDVEEFPCLVTVQFIDYDEATGTILANLIQTGKDD